MSGCSYFNRIGHPHTLPIGPDACTQAHQIVADLKRSLDCVWAKVPTDNVRSAMEAVPATLYVVIRNARESLNKCGKLSCEFTVNLFMFDLNIVSVSK